MSVQNISVSKVKAHTGAGTPVTVRSKETARKCGKRREDHAGVFEQNDGRLNENRQIMLPRLRRALLQHSLI